jgi:transcriptional regulator with XRE-family HTH domain
MEYKLIDKDSMHQRLGIDKIPANIDMFYDLSYDLSTYIFDYRTKHNYTQKQFAEFLGVRQPMVSKLESGNYNISLQSICDVMAKLNTKVKIHLSDVNAEAEASLFEKCISMDAFGEMDNIDDLGEAV